MKSHWIYFPGIFRAQARAPLLWPLLVVQATSVSSLDDCNEFQIHLFGLSLSSYNLLSEQKTLWPCQSLFFSNLPFYSIKTKFSIMNKKPSVVCHPLHLSDSGFSMLSTLPSFHPRHTFLLPLPWISHTISEHLHWWFLYLRFPSTSHLSSSFPHFLLNEVYPILN